MTQRPPVDTFIFDMDGTLVDSDLDFARIRAEAQVPDDVPILEFIDSASGHDKRVAQEVLLKYEAHAAENCELFPHTQQVLSSLQKDNHNIAILTRNSRRSAQRVVQRFNLPVDCVVSRDDATPKPSPDPIYRIADTFNTHPENTLVIGDYLFDLEAARAAGARSALLRTDRTEPYLHRADIVLDTLSELLHHFSPTNLP